MLYQQFCSWSNLIFFIIRAQYFEWQPKYKTRRGQKSTLQYNKYIFRHELDIRQNSVSQILSVKLATSAILAFCVFYFCPYFVNFSKTFHRNFCPTKFRSHLGTPSPPSWYFCKTFYSISSHERKKWPNLMI